MKVNPSPNFLLVFFSKITFLLLMGVYCWTPFFMLRAGFFDVWLPFEAALFIGLSFISFGWVCKLTWELLKK